MATFTCNLNQLIQNAKCFRYVCMSDADRRAIDIYLKIQNLTAIGGTNYSNNTPQLMKDSAAFAVRPAETLAAVDLWIDMQNAINDGALINTNVNALASAAKCFNEQCLGPKQRRGIQTFLKCSINTLIKPD